MNKALLLGFLLLLVFVQAEAKLKRTIPAPATALAVAEQENKTDDQFYRFRRIFLFPGLDDLNGILSTHLDRKTAALLLANPRFELISDTNALKALNVEDGNYRKVAQSEAVHKEAAVATRADATLLVKNRIIGSKTEITMEWRDASGVPLLSQSASIASSSSIEDQERTLEEIFVECLKQIPFKGTVSGRTGTMLTIDLGEGQLQVGDTIDLGRIVSTQRHPLLKTLVKADFVKVGSARVTNVDRVLTFAEIKDETANEYISVNNKIIAVHGRETNNMPTPRAKQIPVYSGRDHEPMGGSKRPSKAVFADEEETDQENGTRLKGDFERPKGRFGNVGAGPSLGAISHSDTIANVAGDYSGTGIGAFIAGEFWVTREWILGVDYHYQSANLTGTYGNTNSVALGNSSWNKLDIWGAYRYFPDVTKPADESTVVNFGVGMQKKNANIAANSAYGTSPKLYSGLLFRVDGDILMNATNHVYAGISLVPFGSAPALENVTSVAFSVGWGILLQSTLWGRITLDYDSVSASGANNSGNSRGDRRYAILPAIYFYF